MSENIQSNIDPIAIQKINQQRIVLRDNGFKFEYDHPNTAKGRAGIMAEQVALETIGFRTRVVKAITLIDLWKKLTSEK